MEPATLNSKTINESKHPLYFPKRFVVVILGFVGILMTSTVRSSMSVAMVAMTDHSINRSSNHSPTTTSECPVGPLDSTINGTSDTVHLGVRYPWDPLTQSNILSAYFYCYFITVFCGGWVAQKVGAARLLGCCIFLASALCFALPAAAASGPATLIVVRTIQGLCGGACLPSMSAVVSKWSPKLERSVIMTIVFTGALMSTVIGNPISGWLTTVQWVGGWPAIFYCVGVCGCAWSFLWFYFVYESPGLHSNITQVELMLYAETLDSIPPKQLIVPWQAMLSSLPLWSVLIAQSGATFTFNIMMVELPSYLFHVLHFDIKASSALSMLPFLADSIGAWTSSYAADRMRATGRWRITAIRKCFNSIAGFSMCLCLLGIPFSGCNSSLILGLLIFGMFVDGLRFAGFHATSIDMTPDFAGTMYSLCYGTASVFGIAGPQMVGLLTRNGATVDNWSKVFYVTAAIKFITTLFYAIFASAELQSWGKATEKLDKQRNGERKC
ncbi:hypothetical protein JTE90_028304 [Oedothorax gibbosus]|uniref:Major facilitator superfamily (MFS) profile domain-containing protein n=1 Tax=Oedothorax gibbosus TaxID=931172 RepID=A0AAV6U0Z4_9ARAC|nr:hypothetical protein JTE90_028304 [Oedothorax gibbosus]